MRLLIVSNRLPFTVTQREGRLQFQKSVGGVVSGVGGYLELLPQSALKFSESVWVGWPGITARGQSKKTICQQGLRDFKAYPVFLSEGAMEKFYHGFCNKTIWPLFHSFPSHASYDSDFWFHYQKVNEGFCQAVLRICRPDDVIWVQDYHLMLLPKLLKARRPHLPVGFFLHIPFPPYEIFQLLPQGWRRDILEGMMGSDLVGFHTHEYAQNFMRSALRLLGVENQMGVMGVGERWVKADTYPIGIDFKKFFSGSNSPAVRILKKEIQKSFVPFRIVFSVDRLDYTKGIAIRLQGFASFLEKNPQWREQVVFNLIVVPSRVGVESYQAMRREIDALVGRINGRFGTVRWTPVIYQYRAFSFAALVARYAIADVALITPLRDGMNLVAKEYVASHSDQKGVLILSEMAGAAKELGEAIIINPNDQQQMVAALEEALRMPIPEQIRRMTLMQKRLQRYDILRWGDHFLGDLLECKAEQKQLQAKLMDVPIQKKLITDFQKAGRKLIFLDYDGTLVPFSKDPQQVRPPRSLLKILTKISQDALVDVVLISGRDKKTLEKWFGALKIGVVSEHGAWLKEMGGNWVLNKPLAHEWKSKIGPILEVFSDRLPGSFIEEKEHSLVWHYRGADPEQALLKSKDLTDDLVHFVAGMEVEVVPGNKIVEIRSKGIDKGSAGLRFISKDNYDFILAIGDDTTDEDLFVALPPQSVTVRVGWNPSRARYHLRSPKEVLGLLKLLIH